MKNTLRYTLFIVLVLVGLVSCYDEYLEPVPKTQISDVSAFETGARTLACLNGVYGTFQSGQYLGGRYLVYNDIKGDDFLNWGNNGVTGLQTWKMDVTPSTNEVQNCWQQLYIAINAANVFLEGIEINKDKLISKNELTQAQADQYKGEVLALRGLAYFHLIQLYARPFNQDPNGLGAILRLKPEKSSSNNSMARSTIQETYNQILSDLNEAETLLPVIAPGTANSAATTIRLHKNSVIAIKTRVYLHMNNYATVLTEGNKIVPATAPFISTVGVANGLANTFGAIFVTPYTTRESLFSIPMTATERPGTQNGLQFYYAVGEYTLNTAHVFWVNDNVIAATDARKTMTVFGTGANSTKRLLNKFPSLENWVPVIRYAEVLLNVAEAEARVNGVNARAVALLNAVYLRSNPTATPYVTGDFATANAFVNRVMQERNIEFLGEGIRNMDVTRKLADFGAKATVPSIPYTNTQYCWPIPQSEINTNLLVQPNP